MLLQCRAVPRREGGVVGAKGKGRKEESTWRKGRAYDSEDEDNGSDDDVCSMIYNYSFNLQPAVGLDAHPTICMQC